MFKVHESSGIRSVIKLSVNILKYVSEHFLSIKLGKSCEHVLIFEVLDSVRSFGDFALISL